MTGESLCLAELLLQKVKIKGGRGGGRLVVFTIFAEFENCQ